MKKIALILAALVAGASLSAQAPAPAPAPAAPSYSVTLDFPYTTKYVFRGVEVAQSSFQPSVKITKGDAYVGLWTNQPITSNIDNEIDFFGGYNFKLAEGWTLDAGATIYYYPELDHASGAHNTTTEGYLGVNGTVGGVGTATYLYYDFTLKAFTAQETLSYTIPLDKQFSLAVSGTLGHVSPNEGTSYYYYGLGATVPCKLSDSATLSVGAQWANNDLSGLNGSKFWGVIDLTVTF